jgi:thiamine-monophosphate kinase
VSGNPSIPMGPGREFDLIRRLVRQWGNAASGLGDDAAVVDVPQGAHLVVSTDSSVEGVHFRNDWMTHRETGFRSTVAALSDLAAMAAEPLGMLVAATLPPDVAAMPDELAAGIADASRLAKCPIVGGDLTRGDRLSLTITVLGSTPTPIRRDGAVPGQEVVVTGELGGPGAAIRALLTGSMPSAGQRARLVAPVPRLREARWLAAAGASALIDISDGLAAEARHLAAASRVGLTIDLDSVPSMAGVDARSAATSGEEYELLAAVPPGIDVGAFEREFGVRLTIVGRVERGDATATFAQGGVRVDLPGGYDHFSR